tara:strand:+ start:8950 stop:9450 length:501 start_codon:yes stop_codon:yes gene_type:complete
MKGKLIKTVDGYELFTQGFLKDSTNHGLIDSLNIEEGSIRYKLSLKNCQAIERGYDLDELAMGYDLYENINFVGQMRAYKAGFQKALELMGDKKFSEEQLRESFLHVQNDPTFDVFKQSLQQTEWDVDILEECLDKNCDGINKKGECITTGIPKLDEEGCLILKKL